LIFGFIYLNVPAGATIYMVVSSAMRIGTQEVMFRTGMVTPVVHEREIGATTEDKLEKAPPKPSPKPAKKQSSATDGTSAAKATLPPSKGGSGGNGRPPTNGKKPPAGKRTTNGDAASDDETQAAPPKAHPRSRSKRSRKAR
jgi:hypothetical protein